MHYPPKRGVCIVAWSASLWRARRWRKKDASAQASTPIVSLATGERSLSECIACPLVLGLQGPSGHVRSSTRPYPQPLRPGRHSCRPGHGHRVRCADMMSAPSVHRSPGCAASLRIPHVDPISSWVRRLLSYTRWVIAHHFCETGIPRL
jgi:hypothetical protein